MYYSEEMFRDIIMDHIKNPRNKDKDHEGYLEYTLKNPSCGDIVTIYVKLNNNIIEDITYKVEGCSICCSSVSMLSENLKGMEISKAKEVIRNFEKMVIGEDFITEILGDAISLKGVYNTPPRIKCATLGYKALEEVIGENNE